MRKMLGVCAILMFGCYDVKVEDGQISHTVGYGKSKFVDVDAGVTCYIVSDGTGVGISCVR